MLAVDSVTILKRQDRAQAAKARLEEMMAA